MSKVAGIVLFFTFLRILPRDVPGLLINYGMDGSLVM